MSVLRRKKFSIALAFVAGAILLSLCGERAPQVDSAADEAMMTEYSENLTIIESQNGKRSYRFTTPLVEGYSQAREPYREFRKGIRMVTYQDDSLTSVDVVLTANYAIYYENRKLWEAKGNVVVEKHDGKKLYTQQLFWNATTKKVYSNVDTRIVQEGRSDAIGAGFETDEEFRDWRFRYMKGQTDVDVSALDSSDSTRTERSAAGKSTSSFPAAKKRKPERKSVPDIERNAWPDASDAARSGDGPKTSNSAPSGTERPSIERSKRRLPTDRVERQRLERPAEAVERMTAPAAFKQREEGEPTDAVSSNQSASEK